MASDADPGSGAEPQVRHGMRLPRVVAVPGLEQLSPTPAPPPAPDADVPDADVPDADVPDGPRHRRASRSAGGHGPRRLGIAGAVCAVVLVATVSAVAFARTGSAHRSDASATGDRRSAVPNPVPSVPSSPTGTRPAASTSASVRPAHSATPHSTASPKAAAPRAADHWQTVVVHATYVLNPGGSVRSNRIRLSLLTEGDLVLRDEHGRVTWSAGTRAQGTHAVFQADGNLVVYEGDQTLWSSRTDGHDGATLVLGADGDMRIVSGDTLLWHTGTGQRDKA